MALPRHNDAVPAPAFPAATREPIDHGYRPGGQVGQMQAELAQRLLQKSTAAAITVSPEERVVRFLSVAGGYIALLSAYAGAVLLILR